ncbi:carboxymuconolactone decarboxylase family protein [Oceanivirga salmonicida]|uniref:carboxymuconolactone decarboxylase family protein n=1 Tax=Oceanivirga salmonicida TaxID=1769291 RepID=UPI00083352CD|nr:carboxymuconolactone decarboxylase family protein [Oceanivirga salmonicida]
MDHVKNLENLKGNTKMLVENIPDTMAAFSNLTSKVYEGKILSLKQKELIVMGIAVAVRCEGCIESHAKNCVSAGVTREEFAEAISLAIMMGGGPSVVYGGKAMEAFEQFLLNK